MVLLATLASRRFGEVIALQRRDIDLKTGPVRVRRTNVEVRGGGVQPGPPKSAAGRRTVSIPPSVVETMREHLTPRSVSVDRPVVAASTSMLVRRHAGLAAGTLAWTSLLAGIGRVSLPMWLPPIPSWSAGSWRPGRRSLSYSPGSCSSGQITKAAGRVS